MPLTRDSHDTLARTGTSLKEHRFRCIFLKGNAPVNKPETLKRIHRTGDIVETSSTRCGLSYRKRIK